MRANMKLVTLCLAALTVSCGPVQYSHYILQATGIMAEAEEAQAEEEAPYEYTYAREHLDQARREVGYSDFQEAVKCARVAREYGEKARDIAIRARREKGR